jgi:CRISPR-associated protein (TIGR02584 family)
MPATLLAVTGLSPAIVTETVWALAHEKPRCLPARVVFITTATGAAKIKEQLHTPLPALGGQTAWQALRTALKAKDDELIAEEPRLIGMANKKTGTFDPLPDIQTREENDIAASFILEEGLPLAQLQRIVLSMAAASRVAVPLKAMCSRKWETPLSSGVSCRVPTAT